MASIHSVEQTSAGAGRTIVLIPARMASTRLPGKPLADIGGHPMIVQVALRAREADIGRVVVATDTAEVADAGDRDELGSGDGCLKCCAGRGWDDPIVLAGDDQGWHVNRGVDRAGVSLCEGDRGATVAGGADLRHHRFSFGEDVG